MQKIQNNIFLMFKKIWDIYKEAAVVSAGFNQVKYVPNKLLQNKREGMLW